MFSTPVTNPTAPRSTEWDVSILEFALYMEDVIFERNESQLMAIHSGKHDRIPAIMLEGVRDAGNKFMELLKRIIEKVKQWTLSIVHFFRDRFASIDKLIKTNPKAFDKEFTAFDVNTFDYDTKTFLLPKTQLGDLVHDFNALINGAEGMDKGQIEDYRKQWVSDEAEDTLRGELAGTGELSASEFVDAIKRRLHGGEEDRSPVTIEPSSVNSYMQKYTSVKKNYQNLLKVHDGHLRSLNRLKSFFAASPHLGYSDGKEQIRLRQLSTDGEKIQVGESQYVDLKQLEVINALYNLCWTRTEKYIGIFNTAYSTTFTVMREELKDYETILRRVLTVPAKKEEV